MQPNRLRPFVILLAVAIILVIGVIARGSWVGLLVPTATPTLTATPSPTATATATATPTATPTPAPTPVGGKQGDWQLKFSDEFDGTNLDTKSWNTCYPYSCTNGGNHELECYVPENVSVSDGMLRLKAEARTTTCPDGNSTISRPFASGMVTTQGKYEFLYGYMEARFRSPKGLGLWPALWTLPADLSWPPEIDAMEILGHDPNTLYMTYHYGTADDHRQSGDDWNGPDFSADWHVMGVYWSANEIRWYIDGVERRSAFKFPDDIVHKPMYFLADFAVGGDWPGPPDSTTKFPAYFDIDYVRIWQTR